MANFSELIDPKEAKWKGIPTKLFFVLLIITVALLYIPDADGVTGGYIRNNFLINFSVLAVLGIFIGEIGDRIPVWNKYVGGGTILVFFTASLASTYGLFPEVFVENTAVFYNENPVRFLEIFIPALIVGSVLTVNRKVLIKSVAGYIPMILIGVVGATVCAIGAGFLFGKTPSDVILNYVLPIMGGGTGAGAIPMSEMYASATGDAAENWFAFAISILTIANIFAIITGAMLNALGEKKPELTGNGELLIVGDSDSMKAEQEEWETIKSDQQGFAAAFIFTGILFLSAHFLSEIWSMVGPSWFEIHRYAMLVILAIVLNVAGIIPAKIKAGAKSMQVFFTKNTLWILMMAVGSSTDFQEIINAFTFSNVVIALAVVLGATLFIMLTSKIFKFYPIEAAITAGLCMANRGGSGDVAVLGAANRMDLISFGQISSRIGGAIMLMLGGILFNVLM
ncbi:MAG: 2-hydroxycarboxylate transporter family protein [Lachnospirales bacterium]